MADEDDDKGYQQVRAMRETRIGFFADLLSLTKYFIFDDWQHLMDFMLTDIPQRAPKIFNTSEGVGSPRKIAAVIWFNFA